MKNKLLILVLLLAVGVAAFSCFCKETKTPYVDISEIFAKNHSNNRMQAELPDQLTVEFDKYRLLLYTAGRLIAKANTSGFLIQGAYATSCDPGDGVMGLKYHIVSFDILCDAAVGTTAAGISLCDKVVVANPREASEMPVAEWLMAVNTANEKDYGSPYRSPDQTHAFRFTEPFATDDFVHFTITMELADGRKFESTTPGVKVI